MVSPNVRFELETVVDEKGTTRLYFPYMAISDLHLGTEHCRAEKLSHMLEHTNVGMLALLGDEIDGIYLRQQKKWNFPPWHRQVLAHILRKSAKESAVVKVTSNHDIELRGKKLVRGDKEVWHQRLTDKSIYGILVVDQKLYEDPSGRTFLMLHGDAEFAGAYFNPGGFWNHLGFQLYQLVKNVDSFVHGFSGIKGISIMAQVKQQAQELIWGFMRANREVTRFIDNDGSVDGLIYGHFHMGGIRKTPEGKLLLNTGCCTEHVQALVHDRHGHFGFITWHRDRLDIIEENGKKSTLYWKELGVEFPLKPSFIEDDYTKKADRLLRLIYRIWPPRDSKADSTPIAHPHRRQQPKLRRKQELECV